MTSRRNNRDRGDSRRSDFKGYQLVLIVLVLQCFALSSAENVNLCENQVFATVFEDPDDCTKYFECNIDGETEHLSCASGQKFDISLERCVIDENPPCKVGTQTSIAPTTSSSGTDCSNEPYCKASESGTFHRDRKDCNKYHVCMNGVARTMTCDTGFHFDENIKACNYPALVKCYPNTNDNCSPKPTEPSTAAPSTEAPTTSTVTEPSTAPPTTPAPSTSTELPTTHAPSTSTEFPSTSSSGTDCSNEPYCKPSESGTFHRDRKDCGKFHLCMNGVDTVMNCDVGFHFDENIKACNYPALVKCYPNTNDNCSPKPTEPSTAAPSTEAPTTSTVTEPSTAPSTTPAPSTSTEPPTTHAPSTSTVLPSTSSSGTDCSNEPYCKASESGTFHRDRKDCNKYHVCMNGVDTVMACDKGFHFDETINSCNYPALVKCSPSIDENCLTKSTEPSTARPSTEAPTTSTVTEPSTAPSTTEAPSTSTEPPTTHAPSTSTALPSTSSPGTDCSNEPYCKPSESGTFHRDRKDCNKYHVCMNGVDTVMACDKGFHFDETINACNYPALVKCSPITEGDCSPKPTDPSTARPSTEAPTTSTVTEHSTEPPTTHAPSTSTVLPSTSSPVPECSNEPYCKASESGTFHRDRKDCNKYHVCMNGKSTAMACDTGFHFDETVNACNLPSVVQCSPTCPTEPSSTSLLTTISTTLEPSTSTTLTTTEVTTPILTTTSPPATECVTEPNCKILPHGSYHRDRKDCRKFYVCSNGVAVPLFCQKWQYFNDIAKVCDFEYRVECTTLDENCNAIPNCKQEPRFSFHRDSQDCSKFFICQHDLVIRQSCRNGEYFDLKTNSCQFSVLVDCKKGSNVQPPSPKPIPSIMIPNGNVDPNINDCMYLTNGVILKHPLHCSFYYICHNGEAIKYNCPDYKWFDYNIKTCNSRNLVNCPSETD